MNEIVQYAEEKTSFWLQSPTAGVIPADAGIQEFHKESFCCDWMIVFQCISAKAESYKRTLRLYRKAFPLKDLDSSVRWNDASLVEILGHNNITFTILYPFGYSYYAIPN